jgi:hypothetical protein
MLRRWICGGKVPQCVAESLHDLVARVETPLHSGMCCQSFNREAHLRAPCGELGDFGMPTSSVAVWGSVAPRDDLKALVVERQLS